MSNSKDRRREATFLKRETPARTGIAFLGLHVSRLPVPRDFYHSSLLMKPLNTLLFSFFIFFACDGPRRDVVPQRYTDFDSAIEALATAEDISEANAAAVQLYSGGVPAIDALRKHLSDERVIPSGFCSRSLSTYTGVTMADQALWSIQDMIETGLPKVHDDSYYVLRNGNLEQWLDERKGMSIDELKTEAARAQLIRAKQQMATGDPDAKGAIEIIEDRLKELGGMTQD